MSKTTIALLIVLAGLTGALAHGSGKKNCHQHGGTPTHCHP